MLNNIGLPMSSIGILVQQAQFEPHGFLVTKISGLAVMAGHFALRGEQPSEQDVQRVLAEETLQVVVTVFGDSPVFARDSYMLHEARAAGGETQSYSL